MMLKARYKDYTIIKDVKMWRVYVGCLCLAVGIDSLAGAVAFCDSVND